MHELVAPTLNFTILVIVLVAVLRKPLKAMVANRQSLIKAQVAEAQAQKTDAERRYREFSQKLGAFEAEARTILERARHDGEALQAKIAKDARANADRIIKDAAATVEANIQEYRDRIRRETIAKAVEIAERMIRDRLSIDDQRRIVNEYVEKVQ